MRKPAATAVRPRKSKPAVPAEVARTEPAQRNCVVVKRLPEESEDAALARVLTQPNLQAAVTTQLWSGDHEVNVLALELASQIKAVNDGDLSRPEGILTAQAHTLDLIFNQLARKAHQNLNNGFLDAGERYLRLALKSQGQCRATLQALGEIKNPLNGAYVRQANLAQGHQQINNGVPRAREVDITPSKQSGEGIELLQDARAPGVAGTANSALETVGEIDRAEISRWQGDGGPEPVQGGRSPDDAAIGAVAT